jgi:hypothetical protein
MTHKLKLVLPVEQAQLMDATQVRVFAFMKEQQQRLMQASSLNPLPAAPIPAPVLDHLDSLCALVLAGGSNSGSSLSPEVH